MNYINYSFTIYWYSPILSPEFINEINYVDKISNSHSSISVIDPSFIH